MLPAFTNKTSFCFKFCVFLTFFFDQITGADGIVEVVKQAQIWLPGSSTMSNRSSLFSYFVPEQQVANFKPARVKGVLPWLDRLFFIHPVFLEVWY